jgi:hypothetical protein
MENDLVDTRPQGSHLAAKMLYHMQNLPAALIDGMQNLSAALIGGAKNIPAIVVGGTVLAAYVGTRLLRDHGNAEYEQLYDKYSSGLASGYAQGHSTGYLQGCIDATEGGDFSEPCAAAFAQYRAENVMSSPR